jgi:hypothetical protein
MTDTQKVTARAGELAERPRLRISGLASQAVDGRSVWYAGQICYNHVLADIIVTLDGTGEVISTEAVAVGSC